ncbi:transcriptional regulator [Agromyces rhizosphaerae]|uniref:Transcriptional regulator n=1 Tax=Agromyces rhizosphaerae TaxID=88374 RepID=A0A9W6CVQ2_9MICO|nr:substrate-binding domain-containing protein [Agromyces rhizosphaerae]GLI26931.1 transcriptional regulator [Agromyces rhizosphaerae]
MGVTIAEIAELAEVSVPTVSKVLNGRPGVSAETRDLVGALLQEHGYVRRGGGPRRVGLVDFVITDLSTTWAHQLLIGAEAEAARAGVGLVVTSTHDRRAGNKHWIRQLAARRSDGIVLVVSELHPGAEEELARLHTPIVLIDSQGGADSHAPIVAATNWSGGLAATEHLLQLGHRRIGIITGPERMAASRDRLDGYRAALARAGVPFDPDLVRYGDYRVSGGQAEGQRLLELSDRPTAIFAGSDHQAHGVYLAAARVGLAIPRDLSVVGFDDVDICEWIAPSLTTVRQPLADMAREATRLVLALGEEDAASVPQRRELATSLVMRRSTAPPRND